ncbi:MAG: pyridoxal phosphate-dependent aminotransferase [Chlorobi bacterium]|nr:pyridoxal phosphate-dependent aminotransferase [Chlorobiota bacterium]
MGMPYSIKAQKLKESATIRMSRLARDLSQKGVEVIDLSLGEPDFNTPEHVCRAAYEGALAGYTHYPPVAGYPDLRRAIVDHTVKEDISADPDNVVVSTGAKQALYNIFSAILDEGSGVALPVPYWVSYRDIIEFVGGRIVEIMPGRNFKITAEGLENALKQPDVRIFLFNSPSNPSGVVYRREEIAELVSVLEKFPEVWIISDEVYDRIIYDGEFVSIAEFESVRDRVIIVNSCSKSFAMTGWRLGWMVSPNRDLAVKASKIQGQVTSGANSVAQRAAITAITGDQEPFKAMYREFKGRRDFVISYLENNFKGSGIKWVEPQGAFYLWLDISEWLRERDEFRDGSQVAEEILKQVYVATVGGNSFGLPEGLRLSLATSKTNLEKGLERLKRFFLDGSR